jgi:hypothetical protein
LYLIENIDVFLHSLLFFRDDVSQSTSGEYVYESYYDDYTPEMESEYSSYGYAETTPPQNEYYQQNENDGYAAEGQQNQQYYPQQ